MEYTKSYTIRSFGLSPPSLKTFVTGQVLVHPFLIDRTAEREPVFVPMSDSPFALYDPLGQLRESKLKKGVPPPYLEFANLNSNDEKSLLQYVNTHGIPPSLVYNERSSTPSANQIRKEGLRISPYPIKKLRQEINSMQLILELKAVVANDRSLTETPWFDEIVDLLKETTAQESALIADRQTKDKVPDILLSRNKPALAATLFRLVNRKLKGVSLTINVRLGQNPVFERSFQPTCLIEALYATLAEDIASPIQKCANLRCGKLFPVEHQGSIYCSHECGVRVAKRKYYYRQKNDGLKALDTKHQTKKGVKDGKKTR